MAIRYKNKELPFALQVVMGEDESSILTFHHFYDSLLHNQQPEVFINESIAIGVRFYIDQEIEYLPNASLQIETSLYNDDGKTDMITIPIQTNNHTTWLFRHNQTDEFPWRLGLYRITLIYEGATYYTFFGVNPIHLSKQQVNRIHHYLKQELDRVCYDLVFSNQTQSIDHFFDERTEWYFVYTKWLKKHEDLIYQLLTQLSQNIKGLTKTSYQVQPMMRKQDHKTLRWQHTLRGISMNNGNFPSLFYLNKQKELNINSAENRWIKHIIVSWASLIKKALYQMQQKYFEQKQIIEKLEKLLQEEKARKKEVLVLRNIAASVKEAYQTRISDIFRKIKEAKMFHQYINTSISIVQRVYNHFSYVLTQTDYQFIERGTKQPIIKDHTAQLFINLYKEGQTKQRGIKNIENTYVPVFKPTWQLFELYVLFNVIRIFKESGYTMITDLQNQFTNKREFIGTFNDGECFVLENETSVIEIWYEKQVTIIEIAEQQGEAFWADDRGGVVCPDIRVDYYKKSGENQEFMGSLIIECKHRKLRDLYIPDSYSSTEAQLGKYHNILYLKENASQDLRERSAVKQVLCVFSGAKDDEMVVRGRRGKFYRLFPSLNEDELQIVGYDTLKEEILQWKNTIQDFYAGIK
jgi:hypothetical protein